MKPAPSLQSLTRPADDASHHPPRRMPSWLIPAAIVAGFAVLFLALFKDRLLPAPEVEVATVLATSDQNDANPSPKATGNMMFQASGWIEPDPLPIKATALIDGVIDEVLVLEGQFVKKGETLATLVDDDSRLALAAAEENQRTLIAARDSQIASITSARKKLESVRAVHQAALTLQEDAADQHLRLSKLPKGTVPESDVISARLRHDRERLQSLAAEALSGEAEADIARLELETKVREAEISAAAVRVDQAKLALERTRIVSTIDGRVLRLIAMPGQKKMLAMDDLESSTVAILYQPDKLQVRVDVPLADAAGLSVGQPAKIRCSLLPDRVFTGEVTRITGEADVQRNTLQAKVRIVDPIDSLRPEMLCRVEFFGNTSAVGTSSGSLAVWMPENALTDGAAWVCDPESQRVTRREVQASTETRDGFIRITSGLRPGELVVLSPQGLRERQRVNPTLKQP
ncbi:MAG: HlyD family efflux transporter periplasmic adaptor subunit [Verrucomicrobiaceae bacterium]|nr:MAG: HlyD family efflux transporter periplasmic adaptor subunit [Verrucomicrobiaceae bacterium]